MLPSSCLLALLSSLWLWPTVGAVPLAKERSSHYSVDDNQLTVRQQRRSSQEKLHRAVSRFAATGRGIAGVTEYVMKAVDR